MLHSRAQGGTGGRAYGFTGRRIAERRGGKKIYPQPPFATLSSATMNARKKRTERTQCSFLEQPEQRLPGKKSGKEGKAALKEERARNASSTKGRKEKLVQSTSHSIREGETRDGSCTKGSPDRNEGQRAIRVAQPEEGS